MSRLFRVQFVLMALDAYGFGDHITDPRAFELRLKCLFR